MVNFVKAKELWPCHFHENKTLEATIHCTRPDIWGQKERKNHINFIKRAIINDGEGNTAIAVDPKR